MHNFLRTRTLSPSICSTCVNRIFVGSGSAQSFALSPKRNASSLRDMAKNYDNIPGSKGDATAKIFATDNSIEQRFDQRMSRQVRLTSNTHHLHVYATKHNTHLTLTRPDFSPMLSLSAGNIGFRKANRGTYDAAFQLASYVFNRVQEQGWLKDIQNIEIILRGFGVGREAVTKAMLGSEGIRLRPTVIQVTDATRLKFGGTRSRKPRRLG